MITVDAGFFNVVENDCYMYKVQDVELRTSFLEKVFSLGTVVCYTGDITNSTLVLEHIRNAKDVKNFILEFSEAARLKRRVLTTMDVGSSDVREEN